MPSKRKVSSDEARNPLRADLLRAIRDIVCDDPDSKPADSVYPKVKRLWEMVTSMKVRDDEMRYMMGETDVNPA